MTQINISFDSFQIPEIPEKYQGSYQIASLSQKNIFYNIDLKNVTCTCRDFIDRRAKFTRLDVRRICKHIASCLENLELSYTYDPVLQMLIENKTSKEYLISGKLSAGHNIIIEGSKDYPWWNIYVKRFRGKNWDLFRYNPGERKWASNNSPPGVLELKKIINFVLDGQGKLQGRQIIESSGPDLPASTIYNEPPKQLGQNNKNKDTLAYMAGRLWKKIIK